MRGMNLEGQRFDRLFVVSYSHSNNGKFWNCVCDCGSMTVVSTSHLRAYQNAISCGCLNREIAAMLGKKNGPRMKKHGLSKTKLKTCYDNMYKRCYVDTANRYERYGGRGISMCEDWLNSRISFYQWALSSGYKEGMSIERIDIDGDYCPENCKWISLFEQQSNTSRNIFFNWRGKKRHLAEICRLEKVSYVMVYKRIARGWSIDESVSVESGGVR